MEGATCGKDMTVIALVRSWGGTSGDTWREGGARCNSMVGDREDEGEGPGLGLH